MSDNGRPRKMQRSDSGQPIPTVQRTPGPDGHDGGGGIAPVPQQPVQPAPLDARLHNLFGQINFAAEGRRRQNVAPQNRFILRAENAINTLPTTSQMQTAFGPVTVSRGQADQPMVNTQMGNYNNAQPPGGGGFTTYHQMANALSAPGDVAHGAYAPGRGNAPHLALYMVHEMSGLAQPQALGPKPVAVVPTPLQNRAMATMVGIIGVAEEQCVDGAREMGLSVMRRIVTGQTTFRDGFGSDNPEFPMAGEGGTDHTRQLAEGRRAPAQREKNGLSEMAPPGRLRRWSI